MARERKLFEIGHAVFSEPNYSCHDVYFVFDTEQKVEKTVNLMNKLNHSYYAHEDYLAYGDADEDYFYYKEAKPMSALEVMKKQRCFKLYKLRRETR